MRKVFFRCEKIENNGMQFIGVPNSPLWVDAAAAVVRDGRAARQRRG